MEILKHTHSGLRWLFLLIIIFAIVNAFRKWKSGEKFGAKDKVLNIITIALTHTMGIIGIVLFFISPKIQFTEGLPKTRSGKIMRRILRKVACNEMDNLGDVSTLLNPEVVQSIIDNRL